MAPMETLADVDDLEPSTRPGVRRADTTTRSSHRRRARHRRRVAESTAGPRDASTVDSTSACHASSSSPRSAGLRTSSPTRQARPRPPVSGTGSPSHAEGPSDKRRRKRHPGANHDITGRASPPLAVRRGGCASSSRDVTSQVRSRSRRRNRMRRPRTSREGPPLRSTSVSRVEGQRIGAVVVDRRRCDAPPARTGVVLVRTAASSAPGWRSVPRATPGGAAAAGHRPANRAASAVRVGLTRMCGRTGRAWRGRRCGVLMTALNCRLAASSHVDYASSIRPSCRTRTNVLI